MSLQSVKAKLLAVSLFALSACGTVALFSAVPMIARILSDGAPSTPPQFQAFPQSSVRPTLPPSSRSKTNVRW